MESAEVNEIQILFH